METTDSSVPGTPTNVKTRNSSSRFKVGDRVVWLGVQRGVVFHVLDQDTVLVGWDDGSTTSAPTWTRKLQREKASQENKEPTLPSHPYVPVHDLTELHSVAEQTSPTNTDATVPDFYQTTLPRWGK